MIIYFQGNIFADVVVTKEAQHEEEMMKSDFVRLSWSGVNLVTLPVGAYIIPYADNLHYELLEPYTPERRSDMEWRYEPKFQHPKMYIGKVIYEKPSSDTSGNPISYTQWPFTGSVSNLLNDIVGFINKTLGLSGDDAFGFAFCDFEDKVITLQFNDMDVLSAISQTANTCECEAHLDWERKMLFFGKVRTEGATIPVLTIGQNVQVPSTNKSKEGYFNAYYPQGSVRNITRKSQSEEFVQSDVRLSLRKMTPNIYPDGIVYFDDNGNRIYKHEGEEGFFDAEGNPISFNGKVFMKPLVFEEVYPKTDMYIYDVRYRERYRLDADETKEDRRIVTYTDDDGTKHYLKYAVWYCKLAIPVGSGDNITFVPYNVSQTTRFPYKKNHVVYDDVNKRITLPLDMYVREDMLTDQRDHNLIRKYNIWDDRMEMRCKQFVDQYQREHSEIFITNYEITSHDEPSEDIWWQEGEHYDDPYTDYQTGYGIYHTRQYDMVCVITYKRTDYPVARFLNGVDRFLVKEENSIINRGDIELFMDYEGYCCVRIFNIYKGVRYEWGEPRRVDDEVFIFGNNVYKPRYSFGKWEWYNYGAVRDNPILPTATQTFNWSFDVEFKVQGFAKYAIGFSKGNIISEGIIDSDSDTLVIDDTENYNDLKAALQQGGYVTIVAGVDPDKVSDDYKQSPILDGKKPYIAFQTNDYKKKVGNEYEYALPSQLTGLGNGDGNGHYGFVLRCMQLQTEDYLYDANKANTNPPEEEGDTGVCRSDGTWIDGIAVTRDDFEIEFEENDDVILPSVKSQGIIPRGFDEPNIRNNKVNLYNIIVNEEEENAAKVVLLEKTLEYIEKQKKDNDADTVKSDPISFKTNNPKLFIGQKVIVDNGLNMSEQDRTPYRKEVRIQKLITQVDLPFEQEITIGNAILKGPQTQTKENVEAIISGNLVVGGTSDAYIKSVIDGYGAQKYLSKVYEDIAQQTIGFVKGLWVKAKELFGIDEDGNAILNDVKANDVKAESGEYESLTAQEIIVKALQSPNFREAVGMIGAGFRVIEENGVATTQTDNLIVLGQMIVNSLNIREVSYIGGTYLLTPAGSIVAKVMPLYTTTPSNTKDTRNWVTAGDGTVVGYRVLWLADNGTTATMNFWHQGDQAFCETFNISEPGQYENASNRKYWRLVCREGQVTVDAETYHYADLANVQTIYLYDNDGEPILNTEGNVVFKGYDNSYTPSVPEAGDKVVCLGSQADRTRQAAIQLTAEGIGSFGIYDGINNYGLLSNYEIHFLSKDRVSMSANKFQWKTANGDNVPPTVYRGNWVAGSTVADNPVSSWGDEWTYNGSNWICIISSGTTTEAPGTTAANWVQNKGEKGDSITKKSEVVEYVLSTDGVNPKSGESWSTTKPTPAQGEYVLIRNTITWSDDSTTVITNADRNPNDGQPGMSITIVSQSVTYSKQTSGNLDPSTLTYGSYPSSLSKGDWLYSKTTVNYSDNSHTDAYSVSYIGTDGQGTEGRGISSIVEEYAVNNSETTAPAASSFSTTFPTWDADHKVLWNREVITYTKGTPASETTTPRVKAIWTTDGKGIDSIVNHYVATSKSSGVTKSDSSLNPGEAWSTSVQPITASKQYLWNYEVITFTDRSTSETDPHIIGHFGEDGDNGKTIKTVQVFKFNDGQPATPTGSTIPPTGWSLAPKDYQTQMDIANGTDPNYTEWREFKGEGEADKFIRERLIIHVDDSADGETWDIDIEASTEENYDFLAIGELDTPLLTRADVENLSNDRKVSGVDQKTVETTLSKGVHFIDVVFSKDDMDSYNQDMAWYYVYDVEGMKMHIDGYAVWSSIATFEDNVLQGSWSTPAQWNGTDGLNGADGEDAFTIIAKPNPIILNQKTSPTTAGAETSDFGLPLVINFSAKCGDNDATVGTPTNVNNNVGLETAASSGKITINRIRMVDGAFKTRGTITCNIPLTYGSRSVSMPFAISVGVNLLGEFKTTIEGDVEKSVGSKLGHAIDPTGHITTIEAAGTFIRSSEEHTTRLEKTVSSKNLLPSSGYTNVQGVATTNWNEEGQYATGAAWSPLIMLEAGIYCVSCYTASTGTVNLSYKKLNVSGNKRPTKPNDIATTSTKAMTNISSETYQGATRRKCYLEFSEKTYLFIAVSGTSAYTKYHPMIERVNANTEGPTEWEIGANYYTSLISQTADNIELKVKNCGINIDEQSVTVKGGKFKMQDNSGNDTFVLGTDGNLETAGNAYIGGTIKAKNFFRNVCYYGQGGIYESENWKYYCYSIQDISGFTVGEYYDPEDVPSSYVDGHFYPCTYDAEIVYMIPGSSNWNTQDFGDKRVFLPDPKDFEGKQVEVYSFNSESNQSPEIWVGCVKSDSFAILIYFNESNKITRNAASGHESAVPFAAGDSVKFVSIKASDDKYYWLQLE